MFVSYNTVRNINKTIMQLDNLLKKLVKAGAKNIRTEFYDIRFTNFNLELVFELNGHKISAHFSRENKVINTFCECWGYNESEQEGRYHFFDNFAQVQRWCLR